jgi:tRNA(Ile)-lysidine synthase
MAFDSDVLLNRLQVLAEGATVRRWLVALSGGMDSSVLLHALAGAATGTPIVAVHVDHGLHPDSGQWSEHARRFASVLGVDFIALKVAVDRGLDAGLEAAAREARYRALAGLVREGDWVLSAHHENDQGETLLLNLMRGSGPAGLAGIGACNEFSRGTLARPMLGIPGEDIETYARQHALEWVEDPSNEDPGFDRNFVRHEVMPVLQSRWPAVGNRLRQSAELAGETAELLEELADIDIATCGGPERLSIEAMKPMSPGRQRNLLRRAIRRMGLPPPPATRLYQAIAELVPARADAQPLVSWQGGELRRYDDVLFVLPPLADPPARPSALLCPDAGPVELGAGLGRLQLVASGSSGLDPAIAGQGLEIRFRAGGESIRIAGEGASRKLKKLLQEARVLPWMRDRIPLLFHGDELVAVAGLWVSAAYLRDDGLIVEWLEKPVIN